jgi:hypothetical protein
VLGLILTTQSLINRSLGNSFLSLKLFHFPSKKILLALSLSFSLSSLALNQKSYWHKSFLYSSSVLSFIISYLEKVVWNSSSRLLGKCSLCNYNDLLFILLGNCLRPNKLMM